MGLWRETGEPKLRRLSIHRLCYVYMADVFKKKHTQSGYLKYSYTCEIKRITKNSREGATAPLVNVPLNIKLFLTYHDWHIPSAEYIVV